ncbi:hypothetical protein MMC18_006996 [Xylographa bjoerkii]|nr:hypothetical protein [Xylographa bjoerkii]
MRAPLDTVANEIVLIIIQHVEDQWDLLSLASCSRRCYDLTLPVLYSCIALDAPNFINLRSLVQAVIRKPWLARHVRYLQITPWSTNVDEVEDPDDLVADCETDLLRVAVKAASQNQKEEEEWLEAVTMGVGDAWVALLLVALVNVEERSIWKSLTALYIYSRC